MQASSLTRLILFRTGGERLERARHGPIWVVRNDLLSEAAPETVDDASTHHPQLRGPVGFFAHHRTDSESQHSPAARPARTRARKCENR